MRRTLFAHLFVLRDRRPNSFRPWLLLIPGLFLGLIALPFLNAPARAIGPAISAVSGSLTHGERLTVTGGGFGAHPDDHSDADKLIRVFDDFNDGTLTTHPYGSWDAFNGSANPSPVQYSRENPRTSRSGDGHYRRTHVGLGYLSTIAGNRREYYSSFYMRLSDQFDISSASSGTHQFKIIRLFSTNLSGAGRINLYPAIGASDGFHYAFEFVKPDILRHLAQLSAIPNKPTGWHKMAIYYKKSSAPNANDGRCLVWWDNRQVFDWRSHFENPANDPSNVITGDADFDDGNLAGEWSVGNYFSSASTNTWADFDDIYMSHTLARVELGNASTYAASTVLEPQIPTAWSASQITVQVNLGALSGSEVYLYVTDANGNVNNNGYRLGGNPPSQAPFNGTPAAIPGTIQAEQFDEGGEGVAYHDADAGNAGGAFRSTDVDVEATDDADGGYNVGWTRPGEWLEYTVNVAAAGHYTVEARVASSGSGGTFHVEFAGVDKTGPLTVPDTGGWNNWITLPPMTGVFLNAGTQVMCISLDSAGALGWVAELNWVRFSAEDTPPPPPDQDDTVTVTSTGAGTVWSLQPFASNVLLAEADLTPGGIVDAGAALSDAKTGWANLALNVRFFTNGLIQASSGADGWVGNISYVPNTTYHLRLLVEVSTQTYSAFVTPSGGQEQVMGTNLPFRANVQRLTTWALWSVQGSLTAASRTVRAGMSATYAGTSTAWQTWPLSSRASIITVEADLVPTGDVDAGLSLSNGLTGFSNLATTVRFYQGRIEASNGASGWSGGVPYVPHKTYRVRLVVNVAAETYSAYVTRQGNAEQVLGIDLAFRTAASAPNTWVLWSEQGTLLAFTMVSRP